MSERTAQPIALLGLDPLGEAIAERLITAGHRVVAWDLRPDRRRSFARTANPVLAPSLAELGIDTGLVIATLPHAELRAACLGDIDRDGFAPQMTPGSLIVDMGLAGPLETRQLAAVLGRGGIGLIDAPAIGDADAARAGSLTIPIGGFFEFLDRLTPLLSRLGTVLRAGPHGNGHALAAAMAYARFARAAAAREALRVGESLGLPAELMPDVAAAAADGNETDPRLAIAEALAQERGGVAPAGLVHSTQRRHGTG